MILLKFIFFHLQALEAAHVEEEEQLTESVKVIENLNAFTILAKNIRVGIVIVAAVDNI